MKSGTNILVVDDSPEVIEAVEAALSDVGADQVLTARTGDLALRLALDEADLAVMVLDVSMPEMSGFELAGLLRQHPRFATTPIIFMTGVAMEQHEVFQGYELGAVDYIFKPVDPHVLRSKVRVFVELKRLSETLEERVRERTAQLEDETARVRSILDSAVDGIITADTSGRIESFNPAAERLFGYAAAEVIGKPATLLLPEEVHERCTEGHGRVEAEGRRKDGSTFPLRISLSSWSLGGARMCTGIVHDLTEHKAMERSMAQAARLAAMGELAGNIAHEINNPIGIISAKARLLLSGTEELPPKVARDLPKIAEQCDRIANLTRRLLDYCRPSNNPKAPLDVNAPLEKVLSLAGTKARRGGVEVVKNLSADLPQVVGNPDELEQVFLNMLINATHAMPSGGKLTITTGLLEGDVVVTFADTGVGMDEETRLRIFEPFFTTKGETGTGLGLAISHGIVSGHGGRIHVESNLGEGTRFAIRLPLPTG